MRNVLAILLLVSCAGLVERAPTGGAAPLRAPQVRGVFREGFWSPEAPLPGVYVTLRYTSGGRCVGAAGPATRTDSAGGFRLAGAAASGTAPPTRPEGGAAPPAWWLCMALLSRDTVGGLWGVYRLPADARDSLLLDCKSHGEAGSPECAPVTVLPRVRIR
jgi:hypothetical protein